MSRREWTINATNLIFCKINGCFGHILLGHRFYE